MANQDPSGDAAIASEAGTSTQLNQAQIMRATAHCLRQVGYDGTTIRCIAAKLGCSVGSIYRYFHDKRELLSAVTQQMFEPVAQAVESGEPWEHTVLLYHQYASANLDCYALMFWLATVGPERLAEEKTTTRGPAPVAVPKVVERVIEGWATRWYTREQARQVWAMLHGMIQLGADALATLNSVRMLAPALRMTALSALEETTMLRVLAPAAFETALSKPVTLDIPLEPAAIERLEPQVPSGVADHQASTDEDDPCLL